MKPSVFIDVNRCQVCRKCLAQQVCKVKAIIRFDRDDPPVVDIHRCYGCMVCVVKCPFKAVISNG